MTPSAETKTVAEAATALLAKLDAAAEPIARAFGNQVAGGGPYDLPDMRDEIEALRQAAALAREAVEQPRSMK